jgi:segregation and condensation protein B
LETLAVVAYRQPALRAEVEAIRGVACGEILRLLMDRDLLRIVGRSEELGRPLRYGTTKRFLEIFGLCNLDQLPWAAELRQVAAIDGPNGDLGPENSGSDTALTDGIEAA